MFMQKFFREKEEIKKKYLNMLSLARLEDIRIVKQFSRAQILGFFCQVMFEAGIHEA